LILNLAERRISLKQKVRKKQPRKRSKKLNRFLIGKMGSLFQGRGGTSHKEGKK